MIGADASTADTEWKNVAYGFVFSQECINMNLSNSDYVKMLYRGIFGRSYDDDGAE